MYSTQSNRQIIHIDMDAFFASVEQRDNPSLRQKPVIVGGNPQSRGVVSTCSYEARKYGISSAMSLAEAARRCPDAIFLPVNMTKYRKVSKQIHKIFADYSPLLEPISLDEAFLDVTNSLKLYGSAENIAQEIKLRIKSELGLTASVGLASNKFLAKLASDIDKPDGLVFINNQDISIFLDPLPVERIWGVGPKTTEKLHKLNIKTIKELRAVSETDLKHLFGSAGSQLYLLARGIDERPVISERQAKSIGREITFQEDVFDQETLKSYILKLSVDVGRRIRKEALRAKTISLKIRFADFRTISRSITLDHLTHYDTEIFQEAYNLFQKVSINQPIRLLGLSLQNLNSDPVQQSLFESDTQNYYNNLVNTIDCLKERFGENSITPARLVDFKENNN